MRICTLHHICWQILLLSYLTIHFINESEAKLGHAGWAKSDSRTKQILQNLRLHIAQQAEQAAAEKECDPKIGPCPALGVPVKSAEEEDESGEAPAKPEPLPPFRLRKQRTAAQLKKDVAHALALKERKGLKKREKDDEEPKPAVKKPKEEDEKDEKEHKIPVRKVRDEVREVKPRVRRAKDLEVEPEVKLRKPEPRKIKDEPPKPEKVGKVKEEPKPLRKPFIKPKVNEPKPEPIREKKPKIENVAVKTEKRHKPKRKSVDDEVKRESSRFPEDVPVFSLTSDSVKSEQCKKHSRVYLRQLQRYKLWALMMYDATAKLPSGILQGNTNQYGDFDQCISVNATFKKRERDGVSGIQGKYCLATIDVSTDAQDPALRHAIHRSQSFGFVKSKATDPGHFIPRFSTMNWGLCIPSACKAEDLENSIKSSLGAYKKTSGLIFDVKVDDKNCVTKTDLLSDYDVKTFITLLFYAVVIGVATYATLIDISRKNRKSVVEKLRGVGESEGDTDGRDATYEATTDENDDETSKTSRHGKLKALLMAFSLKRNLKKLFIEGESEDSIDCIHGIKSIFTMMLYFAHKTIPLALTPFSNRVVLTEISNEYISVLLRGSVIYTDSFLLISGVLISFNLCKEIKTRGRIRWIRRTIARYIRLTPALLATVLFYANISSHLGSGPMWNVVVGENSELCRQHWWRNILYIQNFYPFEEMCAPQTHQLALDMQLFLISPLLVYFLHEYDKIGIGILQAFLMVSSILRFISTSNHGLSLFIFHGMPISQLYETANLLYSQPIHRATPYIVGVIIGYYLQKAGKDLKLPRPVVVFGWITSTFLALSSLIAPAHLSKQTYEYNPEEAAHYAALLPIAWAVALGWFITACYLGHGGKLNQYLCWRGFIVFSRISYSVYLTQFLVFSHIVATKRIPEMFSVWGSLDTTEFAITILISIIMTLLFDIPTVEIKTIILSSLPSDKPQEPKPVTGDEKEDRGENGKKVKNPDVIPEMEGEADRSAPELDRGREEYDRDEPREEEPYHRKEELDAGLDEYEEEDEDLEYEHLGDEEDEEDEEEEEDVGNVGDDAEGQDMYTSRFRAEVVEDEPDFWAND